MEAIIGKVPQATKKSKTLSIHNHDRLDPYYWLNERENPEVIKYLEDENKYTRENLSETEELQETLLDEIVARIKKDDSSAPYFLEGYYYYSRYEKGKEYPFYCRKKESLKNNEELLLDVNELAKGHEFYQIGGISISPDDKTIAYSADTLSRRIYTIYFRNLETGEDYEETIENTTGGITWAEDNKTIFYTVKDDTLRPYQIYRRALHQDKKDVLIFEEKDEAFACSISKTKSKKYLTISSGSTLSTECRILESNNPTGEFRIFQERNEELEYGFEHFEDKFYIHTNLDAKNFRLMITPENSTKKESWKEIIAHRDEVLLEDFEICGKHLALEERENGLTQIRIINLSNQEEYYLDFGEPTYSAYIGLNLAFDTNIIRYEFSSLTTPHSTIDFNLDTKEKTTIKEQEVVGTFNKNNYKSERIWIDARDGTKVPVSIVYKKDIELNGESPLLLYAYGSYGYSIDASFSSVRLSLLDRGFVYAIAHIRGGEELGRQWYDEGKMLKKRNTFWDYIDTAKALIDKKYTSANNLFAMGGSAGGMLMGVAINEAPELFKGVISAVPFVDCVTTMLDETIPLTTGEYDEWGNPNNKEYYDYMLSYSPYDNVKAQNYPHLLVTTGLHDSQVQYWEPAKWVARLRDLKTDNNLLLLHTNMSTGHSGASGRYEVHRETAMEYAFFIMLANK